MLFHEVKMKTMEVIFFIVLCINLGGAATSSDFPTVSTKLGDINGRYSNVKLRDREFKVQRFLGIPYAKSPVGKLRFKRPEALETLTPNPFSADTLGSSCPQVDIFGMKIAEHSFTEDCLFLNIFIPVQKPDKATGHAVMVYLHGGGFAFGTGNRYIGDRLASTGNVIVVTVNYRLWIWGFLDLNNENAPGNMGLWDQQMAFKWVNENIGSFGGDKDRVTIFGESAGAISVGLHALYPQNKGLFQNVIAESGSPTTLNLLANIKENIQPAKYLAELMNCKVDNVDLIFDCIQNSDSAAIFAAFKEALKDPRLFLNIVFTPTIDGVFMKSSPAELVDQAKTGAANEVEFFRSLSFLNGINGNEGGMWLFLVDGNKESYDDLQLTHELMETVLIPSLMPLVTASHENFGSDVLKTLISSKYRNWESPYDSRNVREQFVKLMGDIYFNVPCVEISRLHVNGSNPGSYLYRFTAAVERHLVPTPTWIRSGNHGDEIGPVFGYQLDYDAFKKGYVPSQWQWDLSERVMRFWSNFAKNGNPNVVGGIDTWPKYTIDNEHFLNIDIEDYVDRCLQAENVNFWRKIVPKVLENCHDASATTSKKSPETCHAENGCN